MVLSMLVNIKKMLEQAVEGKYAVGLFNINNLEWTKSILETHQEKRAPVILGVSEGAAKYMGGYNAVFGMVTGLLKDLDISIPVALMLDHGSYNACIKALDAGFSALMFDGSKLSLDENLAKTKEIVNRAHQKGVSVEAEIGGIGGEEDGIISSGEIASPQDCKQIIETGIDVLAAGIGNIHGKYPENWNGLNFDVLAAIKLEIGNVPIVLHGGSGIPEEQIRKSIAFGVAKINVNTELQIAFQKATRAYIESRKDLDGKGFDPRKLLKPGAVAIKEKVAEKLMLFGTVNKA
jgi:fructose-bisphosphate aldolase class II